MTHEDLLKKINEPMHWSTPFLQMRPALRAVVELHAPQILPGCGSDTCYHCEKDGEPYPCTTIRSIEKHLQ